MEEDGLALGLLSPPLVVLAILLEVSEVAVGEVVDSAFGLSSVVEVLELLEAALSDELDEGRLSVMYQPEPLKMTGGTDSSRRTA